MTPDAAGPFGSPPNDIGLIDRLAAPVLLTRRDGAVTRLNPAALELVQSCCNEGAECRASALEIAFPAARLDSLRREPLGTVARMLVGVRRRGEADGCMTTLDARISRLNARRDGKYNG